MLVAEIECIKAKPFVELDFLLFESIGPALRQMETIINNNNNNNNNRDKNNYDNNNENNNNIEFIEGLQFSNNLTVVITGTI